MSRPEKHASSHRGTRAEPALKKRLRKSTLLWCVAVAATGLAVSGGVFVKDSAPADPAASVISAAEADREDGPVSVVPVGGRRSDASRSDGRAPLAGTKETEPAPEPGGRVAGTEDPTRTGPRDIARAMLPEFGFSDSEFGCLDSLYVSESDWEVHADNPTSSAYGIPQALTGGTHELPADYMDDPVSQIRWGLGYIKDSYGTPCSAWEFKQANDWY